MKNNLKVHPKHYTRYAYQPVDFMTEAFGDASAVYLVGDIIKYVARHRHKEGLVDLQKAMFYLERLEALNTLPEVKGDLISKFINQLQHNDADVIDALFIDVSEAKARLTRLIINYEYVKSRGE